jgi:hypothetical protein
MAGKRRQIQLIECELSDRERTLILDHTFAGPNLTEKLQKDLDRLYGRLQEYEEAARLKSILTSQCS